jgi:hypothetical protein
MSDFPNSFCGMIPVDDLNRLGEVFFDPLPDPGCPIGDEDQLLRLVGTALQAGEVHQSTELLRFENITVVADVFGARLPLLRRLVEWWLIGGVPTAQLRFAPSLFRPHRGLIHGSIQAIWYLFRAWR